MQLMDTAQIGPESCGIIKPPNVVSISYSQDEASASLAYAQRQCWEYGKVRYVCDQLFHRFSDFYSSEWWGHLCFTVVGILVLQAPLIAQKTSAWIAHVCLGSPEVLSCFALTFVYEDQEDVNGTVFNPSFPVGADLVSFIPNDALFYFSLRVRT
jgi:hypothetical protein